jgi:hypothetical protein
MTDTPIISFAEFVNLPMTYCQGMSGDWGGHRVYRNNEHGLQMEVVTARTKGGTWKKGQHYYYLDGNDREFETAAACYQAYRWRRGGEAVDLGLEAPDAP